MVSISFVITADIHYGVESCHSEVVCYSCLQLRYKIQVLCVCRPSFDEADRQEAGEDGDHAGEPETVHPATGPAAPRQRGGPHPAAPHTRYTHTHEHVYTCTHSHTFTHVRRLVL